MPAPATWPWFMPMLKPPALETARITVMACLVIAAISSASSSVVSV